MKLIKKMAQNILHIYLALYYLTSKLENIVRTRGTTDGSHVMGLPKTILYNVYICAYTSASLSWLHGLENREKYTWYSRFDVGGQTPVNFVKYLRDKVIVLP